MAKPKLSKSKIKKQPKLIQPVDIQSNAITSVDAMEAAELLVRIADAKTDEEALPFVDVFYDKHDLTYMDRMYGTLVYSYGLLAQCVEFMNALKQQGVAFSGMSAVHENNIHEFLAEVGFIEQSDEPKINVDLADKGYN